MRGDPTLDESGRGDQVESAGSTDEAPLSLTKRARARIEDAVTGPIPIVTEIGPEGAPGSGDWPPAEDFDVGEPVDQTGEPGDTERRFTLRTRLIALVLGVAAIALVAVDILIPLNVRSSLMESKDLALRSQISALDGRGGDLFTQIQAGPFAKSEVGVTAVYTSGNVVILPLASDESANPLVGKSPSTSTPETVRDADGQGTFRALAYQGVDPTGHTAFLVFWVPLADVTKAVGSVVFTELLISLALLVLLGTTASVIIRRELRPLEAMATAADDIAGGDLDRRVYPGDPGTEVGRLGFAFNGMLDGISTLIAERDANEIRMRQFLADASHELRTPVAAVRGYTDLYRAGALPDEAAVTRAMARMGFESERMGALVGDLLMLVQADAESDTRREVVDLSDVLTGVVDDAAVIDQTRIWRLVGADTRGADLVQGDRLRLHQLFANLLGNVRTHTDPGTTATVTLSSGLGELTVTVADNGPGVSGAELPKLFDRFYRVDASRSRIKGGTGLGLSIVAAIVRSHRGRVLAGHTPGGGLTTTVVLPRWTPTTPDAQPEVNRT
ncbi:HAMP domain-containing sensor histidine kinase [Nakamurella sp. A5-74]|uniref:histidine kinase n=1 Tax=Nakamurella sp. A5-74 TaxID=3158264 RepID=A0AAU8DL26_9ACTN